LDKRKEIRKIVCALTFYCTYVLVQGETDKGMEKEETLNFRIPRDLHVDNFIVNSQVSKNIFASSHDYISTFYCFLFSEGKMEIWSCVCSANMTSENDIILFTLPFYVLF